MKKKITIQDVANYAGVSRTTVSYVLNGVNKMSNETKEKVLKAIKELNYQPDFTAVSLSKKESKIIGVMLPSYNDSLAPILKEDQSYSELLGGIEFIIRKLGYDLMLSAKKESDDCVHWIQKRKLDGLIISGLVPEKLNESTSKLGVPIVLIDNYEKHGKHYSNVRIDDELGGYLATKHLIECGHSRICFVGHDITTNYSVDENRINGLKKALQEANLQLDDNLIFYGSGSFLEVGYQIGLNILELGDKITAIFASSDILAIGIMKAIRDHGKKVPEDYSIVGFDDIAISKYASPGLTTIKQDIFKKGIESAKMILKMIEVRTTDPQHLTLPTELVVRGTTKAIN